MKNSLLSSVLLLACALVFGIVGDARAEPNLDFNLVNATGYDIKGIYLSPSGAKEWGPNALKVVLKDGETLQLNFNAQATAAKWDIKAVYVDGKTAEWADEKLTEIKKFTLHWEKEKGSSAVAE